MDKVKAKALEKSLSGKMVSGFCILELLNHGKSAAVFSASKGEAIYAIKVFDDELIAKYGDDNQFKRIQREIDLKNSPHPNLVNIITGGVCELTNNHFIVMEMIEGRNLKDCLSDINQDDIWHYISQLANATKHLDELEYVHRDIKPENIMINLTNKKLTLMDLGVVKPYRGSDLTDSDGIAHFIGTLQYSSPEFLLREELDTPDGWRALTFYQIGAVLHDMIMRKPIFQNESEPYGRLVVAIKEIDPIIVADSIDQELIHLAKCCLLKKPAQRLNLLSWNSFYKENEQVTAKSRIMKIIQLNKSKNDTNTGIEDEETASNELKHRVIDVLKTSIRVMLADNSSLPKVNVTSQKSDNLLLVFKQSPEINIHSGFNIHIQLEIISAHNEAIVVNFFTTNYLHEKILEGTMFKGIYDKEKLCQEYENIVYRSIGSLIGVN